MRKVLEFIIASLFRMALWFRYKIRVEGMDKLSPKVLKSKSGVLFLPNHPTYYIDPIVVTLAVWKKFPIRPMIVEYMYYTPIVNGLMRFLNALPVPNFTSSSNSLKRKKNEQVTESVIEGIKNGENFLIYPAGKVKHSAYESVGGASAVHRIINDAPETNVVLVRIKGLWGSSFSRAILDKAPSLSTVFIESLKIIFKNLIFFTPRREIIIELVEAPADFPAKGSRLELNRYLETWFNQPDGLTKQRGDLPGDSLVLVSYSMWGEQYLPLREKEMIDKEFSIASIPQDIQEKVTNKLAQLRECDPSTIKPEMSLATDLGLDSLDTAELVAFLHDQYDVEGVPANELTSVGKLMALAAKQITCVEEKDDEVADASKWKQQLTKDVVNISAGETIIEAFLNKSAELKSKICCADARAGIQTYATMKLKTIVLAEKIRKLPGKYVGIMLPASVAANILVLATQLAGKIPLMVNWTVGPRHLDSVVKLSDVQVVLSSWAFLDRLSNVELNGIEDKLVMLEDLARTISIGDKLKALLFSKRSTKAVLKHFGTDKLTKDDQAVLLFTSGTESMPKGVPLTHNNILSNLRSAVSSVDLYADDVVYGILPPFHSFGFTVGGLLGLLAGFRIYHSPDPTDGKRLANDFEKWGITIMCGAPTFVKGMLKAATAKKIKSMRLCVSGAEKAPPELFQMLEQLGKPNCLIEGYGITECSPVLTLNPIGANPKGVGKPLPGIEIRIVHPETEAPQATGKQGLILVKGPNVFNGYLNPGLSSPFTTYEGERWYKTGDLGHLEADGTLVISGRMKRFIKMGAEMVSLASIEDALLQIAPKKGWVTAQEGPALAVCAKEFVGGKAKIFLFSVFDVSVDEINSALKESGFSNLVKASTVTKLNELPITGTGKTNYRLLEGEFLAKITS